MNASIACISYDSRLSGRLPSELVSCGDDSEAFERLRLFFFEFSMIKFKSSLGKDADTSRALKHLQTHFKPLGVKV
jgi:hypothetical protein